MIGSSLTFEPESGGSAKTREARIGTLVIAGWAGRDQAAVEHHIAELAALGVPRPVSTPCFYRVSAGLLTQADTIQVVGRTSSGEVEMVVVALEDGLWVGIGSDHTDRELERAGVALSKQLCAKPVSRALWRLDEVAGHWDSLVLQSRVADAGGELRTYQHGTLDALRPPADLMDRYAGGALPPGTAMFCGTLPVIGRIGHADRFEMSVEDPVLGRRLEHAYAIDALPVVS